MSRIFLIPGLGADCRIYKNIHLEGHNITMVEWIEPNSNDTIESYAQKLINQYHISENSIVIGNSMGGMVAVEVAKKIQLKATILISSIKTVNEFPWYFSIFRRVPIYKILPGKLFTSMGFMIKPLFGHMAANDTRLFVDMLRKTSPVFVKWAMGAILNWQNTAVPEHLYHIIGNKDLLFPSKNIAGAQVINNGTHIMIFDKANELNKLLKDIINK